MTAKRGVTIRRITLPRTYQMGGIANLFEWTRFERQHGRRSRQKLPQQMPQLAAVPPSTPQGSFRKADHPFASIGAS